MTLASSVRQSASDPLRFVGRPSRPCRRCGGAEHFVNGSGGIECVACVLDAGGKAGEDLVDGLAAGRCVRLWSVDGQWDSKPDEWAGGDSGASGGESRIDGFSSFAQGGKHRSAGPEPDWSKEIHPSVYRWAERGDEAGDGRSFCFAG